MIITKTIKYVSIGVVILAILLYLLIALPGLFSRGKGAMSQVTFPGLLDFSLSGNNNSDNAEKVRAQLPVTTVKNSQNQIIAPGYSIPASQNQANVFSSFNSFGHSFDTVINNIE